MCYGTVVGGRSASYTVDLQVHGEVVHLVRVGSSVLSADDGLLSGALNFTGRKLSEHDLDSYVDDAYQYGRSWLASQVH